MIKEKGSLRPSGIAMRGTGIGPGLTKSSLSSSTPSLSLLRHIWRGPLVIPLTHKLQHNIMGEGEMDAAERTKYYGG